MGLARSCSIEAYPGIALGRDERARPWRTAGGQLHRVRQGPYALFGVCYGLSQRVVES